MIILARFVDDSMDDGEIWVSSHHWTLLMWCWLVGLQGNVLKGGEMCDLCMKERWKVATGFVFLFGEMNCRWLIVFWTFISWKSF